MTAVFSFVCTTDVRNISLQQHQSDWQLTRHCNRMFDRCQLFFISFLRLREFFLWEFHWEVNLLFRRLAYICISQADCHFRLAVLPHQPADNAFLSTGEPVDLVWLLFLFFFQRLMTCTDLNENPWWWASVFARLTAAFSIYLFKSCRAPMSNSREVLGFSAASPCWVNIKSHINISTAHGCLRPLTDIVSVPLTQVAPAENQVFCFWSWSALWLFDPGAPR